MTLAVSDPTAHRSYKAGALAFVLAGAVILLALAFEHVGGYLPCPLCLQQRYAYYAGIPLLFLALVFVSAGQRRTAVPLFLLVALAFLANAALGAYHAGVEWHIWTGPASCEGAQQLATSAKGLLESLPGINVVRCDEAAWRFAGLSFAGWNVLVSLAVAAMSLRAAVSALSAE